MVSCEFDWMRGISKECPTLPLIYELPLVSWSEPSSWISLKMKLLDFLASRTANILWIASCRHKKLYSTIPWRVKLYSLKIQMSAKNLLICLKYKMIPLFSLNMLPLCSSIDVTRSELQRNVEHFQNINCKHKMMPRINQSYQLTN